MSQNDFKAFPAFFLAAPPKEPTKTYLDDLRRKKHSKAADFQSQKSQIENNWRPTNYIFGTEVLDLAGKSIYREAWLGQEIEMELCPPPYTNIPSKFDPENDSVLISHGLLNNHIKRNVKVISSKNSSPWQNEYDWLYQIADGVYWGAKTKDEAIEAWLKVAKQAIGDNRQYETAKMRLTQVKQTLRDALYSDLLKAVRLDRFKNSLVEVPNSFWINDSCMIVFSLATPTDNILFEQSLILAFLAETLPHQKQNERETEIKKTKSRKTPFHNDIGQAFQKLKNENGQNPSSFQVLKEMKSRNSEYEYFLKVAKNSAGEDVIWYRSATSNDSTMTRKRFDNIVSEYRTGKK